MKNSIMLFWQYIRHRRTHIVLVLVSAVMYTLAFWLYSVNTEPAVYSSVLIAVILCSAGCIDYWRFYRRMRALESSLEQIDAGMPSLPEPDGGIEQRYQAIVAELEKKALRLSTEAEIKQGERDDYYTLWAHQIKTPIAAMKLLLQGEDSPLATEMQIELIKIEQYVEMALGYLRTERMSSDLLFQKCDLDELVRQSVKKFAKTFIRSQNRVELAGLSCSVITDAKWLSFVVEQILSNSLKYTSGGTISIYMDKDAPDTLVIEDTGIGIRPEDIPRLFEKGFTGFNGHENKRSTGLGLYLCKRIMNKLGHTIALSSEQGKGTAVRLGLARKQISFE